MLLVSAYDIIIEPARTLIIILQCMLVVGCLLIAIYVYHSIKKADPNLQFSHFFGIPSCFFFVAVSRAILIYHDFYASDEFDIPFWLIGMTLQLTGILLLNYTIESQVIKKTKHMFTIIGAILTIIFVITGIIIKHIGEFIFIFANASQLIPIFVTYLFVALKGTGIAKKRARIIVFGLIILILSSQTIIFELIGIMDKISATMFAPPAGLIGLSLMGYGFTVND